jgi:hypothetical protein
MSSVDYSMYSSLILNKRFVITKPGKTRKTGKLIILRFVPDLLSYSETNESRGKKKRLLNFI